MEQVTKQNLHPANDNERPAFTPEHIEEDTAQKPVVIGRIAATKMQGNSSREFYFWIDPNIRITPLDLISVTDTINPKKDGKTREVYAQVLDIISYTDAESFLEVFASTDLGNVSLPDESEIERVMFHVAKAQVLGTSDNLGMPVQFNSPVYLADEQAILTVLKADEVKGKPYELPIGYIEQSNQVKVPVSVDVRWLTGPDGAHLNVSGKSRLAAKTSYLLFLVSSILQTQDDTAVIIFNTKGSDLLQIHEPGRLLAEAHNTADEYQQKDLDALLQAWECMGWTQSRLIARTSFTSYHQKKVMHRTSKSTYETSR